MQLCRLLIAGGRLYNGGYRRHLSTAWLSFYQRKVTHVAILFFSTRPLNCYRSRPLRENKLIAPLSRFQRL